MTTIRDKKQLRAYTGRTPDDRLRHSAGMGLGEKDVRSHLTLFCRLAFVLLIVGLFVAFVADRAIAFYRGEPLI